MGRQTETEHVKRSRKNHVCSWCNTAIDVGHPYARWRWYDGADASTVKVHPECLSAIEEVVNDFNEPVEFFPGENPRGCNCGCCSSCDRCGGKGVSD